VNVEQVNGRRASMLAQIIEPAHEPGVENGRTKSHGSIITIWHVANLASYVIIQEECLVANSLQESDIPGSTDRRAGAPARRQREVDRILLDSRRPHQLRGEPHSTGDIAIPKADSGRPRTGSDDTTISCLHLVRFGIIDNDEFRRAFAKGGEIAREITENACQKRRPIARWNNNCVNRAAFLGRACTRPNNASLLDPRKRDQ
jgi:hypothetical protein